MKNKKKYIIIIGIVALLLIGGVSYAFVNFLLNGSTENNIISSDLIFSYDEKSAALSITSTDAMTDEEGLAQENSFDFEVSAQSGSSEVLSYAIILEKDPSSTLEDEYARLILTDENKSVLAGPFNVSDLSNDTSENTFVVYQNSFQFPSDEQVHSYRLFFYLNTDYKATGDINYSESGDKQTATIGGKSYKFKINVRTIEGLDVEVNAPVLLDNMIPVYYDEQTGSWKKASKNNLEGTYKWYDYADKMWANAVTVSEENRSTYLSASEGTEIAMDDINTMWVWIPRYKYTIFNANMSGSEVTSEQEIKIEFEQGTATTGTVSCTDSINNSDGVSEVCSDRVYGEVTNGQSTYTHPAFTFGNEELTGFWFGKFENSLDSSNNIIIKPDMLSWNNQTISTAFEYSRKMELQNNIYGFSSTATTYNATGELTGDTNNFDTHNIKNMEWGAVAYLTQSEYGRCTDGACTEIYINNSARLDRQTSEDGSNIDTWYDTYTGRSGGTVGGGVSYKAYGTYSYDDYVISDSNTKGEKITGRGVGASTTGNIYGIYDMSGGLWDRAMGNMAAEGGGFYAGGSGTWSTGLYPTLKYYDRYTYGATYNDVTAYKRGKLGDATKEILKKSGSDNNGWYSDYSWFPYSGNPWFSRGGHASDGSSAGVFSFYRSWGNARSYNGSRVALVAQES
mgnify:CR=1 FL=1